MLSQQELKQQAADAALEFVEQVAGGRHHRRGHRLHRRPLHRRAGPFRGRIAGTVASSERSAARLAGHGLKVLDLNDVRSMPIYVDGADEINAGLHMIKAAAR